MASQWIERESLTVRGLPRHSAYKGFDRQGANPTASNAFVPVWPVAPFFDPFRAVQLILIH